MANRDMYHNISPVISLAPAARTANEAGAAVDLAGFYGALVVIATGTITDGTHTFVVEESVDGTNWAPVDDKELLGTEPVVEASDSNKAFRIGYLGDKRYIRVAVSVSGASNGGVYSAVVLRGFPRHAPVA